LSGIGFLTLRRMKKEKGPDPQRLDVAALAREGGPIEGRWTLGGLPRLAEATITPPGDAAEEPVRWQAEGESRGMRGGEPQLWLHLNAEGAVWLQCQRCLQPMREPLQVQRSFRFVRDEAQAEAEDLDSEEDVLALPRSLDVQALVEDELILALPLVPRHEVCPQPLPQPVDDLDEQPGAEAANPFAKLAALKRGRPSS
jgi:uncharacterized protein